MEPYLIVSGDFVKTGGMDRANHALAHYLATRGVETHLVAFRVDPELADISNVFVHRVPKLLGSYAASEALLDRVGRFWAARLSRRGGRVVVNGGNCIWNDVNWVHYVHAAYTDASTGPVWRRYKNRVYSALSQVREAKAIHRARVVISNSNHTKIDLVRRVGVPKERITSIYYGIDPRLFHLETPELKARRRALMNWRAEGPIALFIGGLGDRRKGFDTVFRAWRTLSGDSSWDVGLAVAGEGREMRSWKEKVESAGLKDRITFLGKRNDVPTLLAAADLLISPTRYEAYGLAVHEALCCGLPSFVTRDAGIAERYPKSLGEFLLRDPDDHDELARRLRTWRNSPNLHIHEFERLAEMLRRESWDNMAEQIVSCAEGKVHGCG